MVSEQKEMLHKKEKKEDCLKTENSQVLSASHPVPKVQLSAPPL